MSDRQLPGVSSYELQLVLLSVSDNFTFIKKSKQVEKVLDESYIYTNHIGNQVEY